MGKPTGQMQEDTQEHSSAASDVYKRQAILFTVSETLGMHFWIDEDAVFMSAPSYATGGGCDTDLSLIHI